MASEEERTDTGRGSLGADSHHVSNESAHVLEFVNQLTSSEEAMSSLGTALAGPIVASLQAVGVVPQHPGQPRGWTPQQGPQGNSPFYMGPHTTRQGGSVSTPALYGNGPHPFWQPDPTRAWFPPNSLSGNWGPTGHQHVHTPPPMFSHEEPSGPSRPLSQEQEEEEDMEREAPLELHPAFDEELEQNLQGRVEDSVSSFVKQCVSEPASNQERRKWAERYPLPKMEDVVPPKLDMTMRLLTSCKKEIASHDIFLRKLQTLSMDAAGPLIALINDQASGSQPSSEEVAAAVRQSLRFLGSFFARVTQERRRKVLSGISPDLTHMANEEFKGGPQLLFGEEAVEKIKSRHEAILSLRNIQGRAKQPFRGGGTQGRGHPGRRSRGGLSVRGKYPKRLTAPPKGRGGGRS